MLVSQQGEVLLDHKGKQVRWYSFCWEKTKYTRKSQFATGSTFDGLPLLRSTMDLVHMRGAKAGDMCVVEENYSLWVFTSERHWAEVMDVSAKYKQE